MVDTYEFNGRNIWGGSTGSPVQTTNIDYDRRDIDISDEIGYYWPEENPFVSILMQVAKETTNSTEFIWWDKDRPDWWTELTEDDDYDTGDYKADDDYLYVDEANFLNPKDLIKNVDTGEIYYIKEIDYDTPEDGVHELYVERAVTEDTTADWGTSKETASSGDELIKLGNAMEENSLAPKAWATQPVKRFNYVQTFRTPFSGSGDVLAERTTSGPQERNRLRQEKMFEHRVDLARQILFGERKEWIDDDNEVRRMTGGVLQFLRETSGTEIYDLGSENSGDLTESEWSNFCSGALKYGSNTKLFLTSRFVAQRIDEHARERLETTSQEETYGIKLNRYITTHGDVLIATTELFENAYGGMGLMLDVDNIRLRPFAGKDSTLRANIQENDRDGWKDEYMTKAGLQLELPKTHAILEGVS